MDLVKENYRTMIYYHFKIGLNECQYIERVRKTLGEDAPSVVWRL